MGQFAPLVWGDIGWGRGGCVAAVPGGVILVINGGCHATELLPPIARVVRAGGACAWAWDATAPDDVGQGERGERADGVGTLPVVAEIVLLSAAVAADLA